MLPKNSLIPKEIKSNLSSSLSFSHLNTTVTLNKRNYSILTKNNQLGPYLAGLIEGDGSILVPGKDVNWVPNIEIVFDVKDPPAGLINPCFTRVDLKLFEKIQSILGGGYISIRPNGNSGRLIIKKKEILFYLISLINGHMRTPKVEALHRLIIWYNNKNNTNIPLLGLDLEPLGNSSLLSGFLEADGNFYFNFKLNKNGIPIGLVYYLRISQKQTYNRKVDSNINMSNLSHMQLIADFFKAKVVNIEREKAKYIERAYEVRTDKLESKVILFDYLNKFPLFGYKFFAHFNLEQIHKIVMNKEHKLTDGKDKLIHYQNLMKNCSTKDEWTHLNGFYTE